MHTLDILLELVKGGRCKRPEEFQQWAFRLVQALIRFDSAFWADLSQKDGHDIDVHRACLFEQPDSLLEKYIPYRKQDISLQAGLRTPSRTLIDSQTVDLEAYRQKEIYNEFYKPHQIADALFTVVVNPTTDLLSLVSLYREDERDFFTEEERVQKEQLTRFLIESWQNNLVCHAPTMDNGGFYVAFCNMDGVFIHMERGFEEIYKDEYQIKSSIFNVIDEAIENTTLIKEFRLKEFPVIGKEAVFFVKDIGWGLVCIQAKRINRNILSPTQSRVAYLYGVEDRTQNEVSRILNKSTSSIKRHVEEVRNRYRVNTKIQIARRVKGEIYK